MRDRTYPQWTPVELSDWLKKVGEKLPERMFTLHKVVPLIGGGHQ